MKELAPDVWQVRAFPLPNAINVYVIGDVLIDAARKQDDKRILKELEGRTISAHALTHAHSDHQGASHAVCERLGIPFWVGAGDDDAAADPSLMGQRQPDHWLAQYFYRHWTGPGHPVDRVLNEGDDVAGFKVLFTPGHSAGHVCFWRESDGVLILGDVLNNMDPITGIPGLRLPKWYFTPDPERNRESAKRLGPLEPRLVLFGHGKPLRDTKKFVDFCAQL